jgi:F-type H+-transporting ATPase subunit b
MPTDMPAGSVLSFDTDMLINLGIQWINVAVITVVIIVLLYKPVRRFMQNRQQRIQEQIHQAGQDWEEAQELKKQYEQKLGEIEQERETILQQTHAKALSKSERVLQEAKEQAARIIEQAARQAALEYEQSKDAMKAEIIDLSTLIAEKFVDVSLDKEQKEKMAAGAFERWNKAQ